MTLAKGLGGGVPLAALLAHRDVACFEYGDKGGTFCGNPLMAAAGCAVLDTITAPGFLARVAAAGQHLAARLRQLAVRFGGGEVRGRDLLQALALPDGVALAVVERTQEAGLLINAPRLDTLRFMPALTVTDAEIDRMTELLDGVLSELRAGAAS